MPRQNNRRNKRSPRKNSYSRKYNGGARTSGVRGTWDKPFCCNYKFFPGPSEVEEQKDILKKGKIGETVAYMGGLKEYAIFIIVKGDVESGKALEQIGDIYGYYDDPDYQGGGGNCAVDPIIKVPCNQVVDTSLYRDTCAKLPTQKGGAYYLDVTAQRVGGLPPVKSVYDPIKPVYAPKNGNQYLEPLYQQGGGAFQYITNPSTGRKVNINGKIGKQVLKNYLNMTGGAAGLPSNFDANMSNRQFGCRQPEWVPNCV